MANRLPQLNRILAFKDLGFSLEQIAKLLDRNCHRQKLVGCCDFSSKRNFTG
ncbi:hypothetical protein [Scytonema sp. PRP1]|uniref:hypothetical protein n=1 Tax=Scytonema sp. PRP1 TaxID=3120513 RepID=UPI003FA77063